MPSILIVDDDRDIRALLAAFLESNGYVVETAAEGADMRRRLQATAFDLVILDRMLPGEDGLSLCRAIRERGGPSIIMLTALGEDQDRIAGLETGADDYVTKPFNPRELLARVRAVLRRSGAAVDPGATALRPVFRFEGWELSPERRELIRPDGVMVDLSTGEYDLLLAFLEAPNRVLTREHLLDAARAEPDAVFDRAIDVQVSRLRKKIEPDDAAVTMIRTVRGAGYLFVPKVERR